MFSKEYFLEVPLRRCSPLETLFSSSWAMMILSSSTSNGLRM